MVNLPDLALGSSLALGWLAYLAWASWCVRGICRTEAPPNPTPEQQQRNVDTVESWWTT